LGYAQLLVELRVPASSDVDLEGVFRLLEYSVFEGISGGIRGERRRHIFPNATRSLCMPPLLAQSSIHITERLPYDGVRPIFTKLRVQGLYKWDQNLSLDLYLFDYGYVHTNLCGLLRAFSPLAVRPNETGI